MIEQVFNSNQVVFLSQWTYIISKRIADKLYVRILCIPIYELINNEILQLKKAIQFTKTHNNIANPRAASV